MKRPFRPAPLILIPLLVFLCSCITGGRDFNFNNFDRLVLGQLKIDDYRALFGQPLSTASETTVEGRFEIAKYEYFNQEPSGYICKRVLLIEFKDGVLNAYIRASSFDKEQRMIDPDKVVQLRAAVGRDTKKEVLAALGTPDGKALCPTKIHDFKEQCDKAVEVWVWLKWDRFDTRKPANSDSSVYVLFGNDGKVVDVQSFAASGNGS